MKDRKNEKRKKGREKERKDNFNSEAVGSSDVV